MFRWIVGSSLRFRFLAVGFAAALVAFGSLQIKKTPVDVFPEFAAPIVRVQTEAIGLSAVEVEGLITLNLEELLSGVPWLESIRSESVTGLSSITLTFKRGTNITRARQMVQERLTLAYALPNVSAPPNMLQPTSATSRFMMVGVSSKEIEETELSMLVRWTMKPKILGVSGVANVAIWGQRLRQMQVHIDPKRLRDARLMQSDVIAAAGDALWVSPLTFLKGSTPGTGGWIDNPNQRLGVHHLMPIRTPEEMAKVALTPQHLMLTGKTMSLGDVAEVGFSHPPLIGDAFVNKGKGLMLVVEKLPGANTLEVTRAVEKALADLQLGLPGVEIDATVFRLASYIEDSFANLNHALFIGAILVFLVIFAFFFNWRSVLVSAAAIPLSLMIALFVLHLTGATINAMVIVGLLLALAVVIDDAVVDVEKVMNRLRERKEGGSSIATIIYEAALETQGAAVYAVLIVLLALTPIFFMGGVSGAFFEPLALSYMLAVVASMFVGLTVTPALSLILFGKTPRGGSGSPIATWFQGVIYETLPAVVKAPKAVFGIALALAVIGIGLWPFLGQSLLPSLKERTLLVNWTTPPATSHQETSRITYRVSRELQSLPGVRNVGAHIGRAITGDQVVGVNSSQIWVDIDSNADYDQVVDSIRETIDGYPGVDHNLQSYLRDSIGKVLTGESTPVVVRIYGHGHEILQQKAEEVRRAISDVEGLVDLRTVGQVEEPQIQVLVDLEKAGRAGVKPGDVRRSAATVFSGLTVGFLFEEQKIYDVAVWSAPEVRQSLTNIENLLVEKTDRHHVRLGSVAEVSVHPTPSIIKHDGVSPYVDVVANVAGRDLGSVNEEIESRLQKVKFPLEYHPELLGEYAERMDAQQGILQIAIAALIGIFLLLQACFGSWRLAAVAFLALPAAIAGGILAVFAGGGMVSLGSIVGFLAVQGIAARNSVLLINYYQNLEKREGMLFGPELVIRGTRERAASILASFSAIIAALLPILILGRIPGLEIAQPTAIVIIGGVIASTFFTLFVIPALYLVLGPGAGRHSDIGLTDEQVE